MAKWKICLLAGIFTCRTDHNKGIWTTLPLSTLKWVTRPRWQVKPSALSDRRGVSCCHWSTNLTDQRGAVQSGHSRHLASFLLWFYLTGSCFVMILPFSNLFSSKNAQICLNFTEILQKMFPKSKFSHFRNFQKFPKSTVFYLIKNRSAANCFLNRSFS